MSKYITFVIKKTEIIDTEMSRCSPYISVDEERIKFDIELYLIVSECSLFISLFLILNPFAI